MDRQQQLLGVKRKIVDALVPLVLDGDGEATERAEAVLSIIGMGSASPELYDKALEIITSVEDGSLKTDFLMRLLGNVQLDLSADIDEGGDTQDAATTDMSNSGTGAVAPVELAQSDAPQENSDAEQGF